MNKTQCQSSTGKKSTQSLEGLDGEFKHLAQQATEIVNEQKAVIDTQQRKEKHNRVERATRSLRYRQIPAKEMGNVPRGAAALERGGLVESIPHLPQMLSSYVCKTGPTAEGHFQQRAALLTQRQQGSFQACWVDCRCSQTSWVNCPDMLGIGRGWRLA